MKYLPVVIGILVCLAFGMAAAALQSESLRVWYPFLNKSVLTPPNVAFPVAWTTLYILMGSSVGLVWMEKQAGSKSVIALFALQLAANFLWSILFFTFRSPLAALGDISLLFILILIYIRQSLSLNRAAAWLFLPYAVWVAFAWYLNLYVALHN